MAVFNSNYNRPSVKPGGNGGGNNRKKTIDRPIVVKGYDLAKQQIIGEHKGVKYAFSIKPDVFLRIENAIAENAKKNPNNGKDQAPYMGHVINEKMMTAIPVGSEAIVRQTEVVDAKGVDGVKIAVCERVKRIDARKSKLVKDCIVSAIAKSVKGKLRVTHYFVFDDKGVDINDLEGLEAVAKRLDVASESYGTVMGKGKVKVVRPGVGVRFITYYPTPEVDEYTSTNIGVIINRTFNFDYVRGEPDENGHVAPSSGHLLTGAEMMEIRDQYVEFVKTDEDLDYFRQETKRVNPEWDLKINVQPFNIYPASDNDQNTISRGEPGAENFADLNRNIHMHPLYRLTHAKSYTDISQAEEIIGGNLAIRTTLELTADRPEETEDGSGFLKVPMNWAKELFTNGTVGDSLTMVRAADGSKLTPHPKVGIVYENAGANTNGNNTPAAQAPVAQNAPVNNVPARPTAPARPQAQAAAPSAQDAPEPVAESGDSFYDIFEMDGAEAESAAPAPAPAAPARAGNTRFASRRTS